MALTVIASNLVRGKIGAIDLDATLSELHTGEVDVTEHPVEDGGNIADHVRPRPETIQIEGFITNSPFPKDGEDQGDDSLAADAYNALKRIKDSGTPVTIVTKLRTYNNVVMTNLSVPRNSSVGDALQFTATFREIKTVKGELVEIAKPPKRAVGKVKLGAKPTPAADAQIQNRGGLAAKGMDLVKKWVQ